MDEGDWLAAMDAEPDDAAVMGAFADWLDERGDQRAGAFRLLWEAGKVGHGGRYYISNGWYDFPMDNWVLPEDWIRAVDDHEWDTGGDDRMLLAKAWAEADQETRLRWRQLTLREVTA